MLDTGMDAKSCSYVIISGGTGANAIATAFGPSPSFVLPVSDDGGSSSEILRCFGGPSIGDIRSRLTRLIPTADEPRTRGEKEIIAIYNLMAYRFPSDAPEKEVRDIWTEIVEGRNELWTDIGEDKKECIRAFLVHFQTLSLRRAHKRFSFRNFSLGNGFLTGARDLFGSLPSAIFLFKSIAGVNSGAQVIPVISTNQIVTIAASLRNGTILVGQCNISHPVAAPGTTPPPGARTPMPPTPSSTPGPSSLRTDRPGLPQQPLLRTHFRRDSRTFDLDILSPSEPGSLRTSLDALREGKDTDTDTVTEEDILRKGGNIGYKKGEQETPLEDRIERIFYINLYGQEIYPEPNPDYLDSLRRRDILVYSCGSLYTSILPCLAMRGLASTIATSPSLKAKVILLNSKNDRETPHYIASDYAQAIIDSLQRYDRPSRRNLPEQLEPAHLVTHLVYLEGGEIEVDTDKLERLGIRLIAVPASIHGFSLVMGIPMFSPFAVEWAMQRVVDTISSSI